MRADRGRCLLAKLIFMMMRRSKKDMTHPPSFHETFHWDAVTVGGKLLDLSLRENVRASDMSPRFHLNGTCHCKLFEAFRHPSRAVA